MIQVIDDSNVGAVYFRLQVEGGIHVHGDGFNLLAMLAKCDEKGANGFSASPVTNPQDLI